MAKARGGLGRGLNALIPGAIPAREVEETKPSLDDENEESLSAAPISDTPPETALSKLSEVRKIGLLTVPITSIAPNPYQPRKKIDPDVLEELANSIRVHGLVQPPVVSYNPDYDPNNHGEEPATVADGVKKEYRARYLLIAGERRWQAAKLIGLTTIPVVVKETTPLQMLELAIVENIQRADLNPLEEAYAYRQLVDEFRLTQEQVSEKVGKSRTAVTNSLRLLDLPKEILDALSDNLFTEGHARALLMAKDNRDRLRLMNLIIEKAMSVRQTEETARRMNTAHAARAYNDEAEPEMRQKQRISELETSSLEQKFRDALSMQVELTRSKRGGKLVVQFYSEEELEWLYRRITGEDFGI
ncbi:MAG: ParB/RepB/Spo0J family partition protein [Chloroflexi bacterium]|uniref:ParB/RepB/Spo0J family partition protein n=1 Tax=Candidatus Chlorohelix allophototropha TaxID=3003348 RepID=A0A8T7LZU4_9CHLR|nr:ParB/RepB/Spo0J family partition protein [Chloroflexota bacterium]WJW66841.1 ParB/RepB/Spo0J family partition protein [Chloroflexota bacterium L227-S17]